VLFCVSTVGSETDISEIAFKFPNVSFLIEIFLLPSFKAVLDTYHNTHTMTWKTTQLTKFRGSPLRDGA